MESETITCWMCKNKTAKADMVTIGVSSSSNCDTKICLNCARKIGVSSNEYIAKSINNLSKRIDAIERAINSPEEVTQADIDALSKQEPELGARDICAACQRRIIFIGPYWDHDDFPKPRHIATPTHYNR